MSDHVPRPVPSVDRSCLEHFKALEQLQNFSRDAFGDLVRTVTGNSGMCAADACRVASEVVGRICAPLYGQVDPADLAESARHLDVGMGYARRVLRRYRPELYRERGEELVQRLVWGYPDHGFVLDLEELEEIGIPARHGTKDEEQFIEAMASVFRRFEPDAAVMEFVQGEPTEDRESNSLSGGVLGCAAAGN